MPVQTDVGLIKNKKIVTGFWQNTCKEKPKSFSDEKNNYVCFPDWCIACSFL